MGVLGNPFKLFGRFIIAGFQIAGYAITFFVQMLWYILHRQTHDIALAFGDFGRSVTNAIGDVFRD